MCMKTNIRVGGKLDDGDHVLDVWSIERFPIKIESKDLCIREATHGRLALLQDISVRDTNMLSMRSLVKLVSSVYFALVVCGKALS